MVIGAIVTLFIGLGLYFIVLACGKAEELIEEQQKKKNEKKKK